MHRVLRRLSIFVLENIFHNSVKSAFQRIHDFIQTVTSECSTMATLYLIWFTDRKMLWKQMNDGWTLCNGKYNYKYDRMQLNSKEKNSNAIETMFVAKAWYDVQNRKIFAKAWNEIEYWCQTLDLIRNGITYRDRLIYRRADYRVFENAILAAALKLHSEFTLNRSMGTHILIWNVQNWVLFVRDCAMCTRFTQQLIHSIENWISEENRWCILEYEWQFFHLLDW